MFSRSDLGTGEAGPAERGAREYIPQTQHNDPWSAGEHPENPTQK